MDLHDLENTPPWEWPADARNLLLLTLREESASERDRGLAAELAGDLVVMNDELAAALLAIVENPQQPPGIRAKASIALGPALEQSDIDGFEDIEGFEDDDDRPISEGAFHRIRESLRRTYLDGSTPNPVHVAARLFAAPIGRGARRRVGRTEPVRPLRDRRQPRTVVRPAARVRSDGRPQIRCGPRIPDGDGRGGVA